MLHQTEKRKKTIYQIIINDKFSCTEFGWWAFDKHCCPLVDSAQQFDDSTIIFH